MLTLTNFERLYKSVISRIQTFGTPLILLKINQYNVIEKNDTYYK